MSDKMEGALSTTAAIFVLFMAMLDPRVSIAIAVLALIGFGAYKLSRVLRR